MHRTRASFIIIAGILASTQLLATGQQIGTRQIHLDFHTSEHLPDIGINFSREQFQEALKVAHVNAINVFAKGHHSWSYYPTKVGRMHPNLDFDLLGAQIDACHEMGVLAPVYFTVGWSANDAEWYPEWCARNRDGSIIATREWKDNADPGESRPPFHWKCLCVNTGYHEHILAQVEEICSNYEVDGLWFDIYQIERLCYCENCKDGMLSEGIDLDDLAAVERFRARSLKKHMKDLRDLVARYHPHATVFFNGTTAIHRGTNFTEKMYEYNTMQDLEDLPTTWGGYDKLPIQSKFFLQADYPITAMSGKFHTSWGEFGGFKHPNAIKYEAASMIAWGANCNFGDQLHPSGEMDMSTYRNIGQAYAYVEQIEDFGIGGIPVARVGLWRSFLQASDEGTAKMLLEAHVNFTIANNAGDLGIFDVIIIPGKACLSAKEAVRINEFVAAGGALLVIGHGAMNRRQDAVILDIGASYLGEAQYDIDYLVVDARLGEGMVASPFLNYRPAMRMLPQEGSEVLATIREPYFSRTYGKYTSHQNTPYKLANAAYPGVLKNGNVIFFAHDLDRMYVENGARLHRDLFINALALVHDRPMVATELPSAGRVSLLHQGDHNRYVAHLLYGPPIQRGRCEVIEDLPFLYDVPVSLDVDETIKRAYLVPEMKELPLLREGNRVKVVVPEFQCHCAVVFEY